MTRIPLQASSTANASGGASPTIASGRGACSTSVAGDQTAGRRIGWTLCGPKRKMAAYTSPRSAFDTASTLLPSAARAAARTSSDGAVANAVLRACASALATAAPTRRPVKLPGPSLMTTPVKSWTRMPA